MKSKLFLLAFLVCLSGSLLPAKAVSGELLTIKVSAETACSMNCIQIATLDGPWSQSVCSRSEPLARGANCREHTSTTGSADINMDLSGCTTLRMRMFTIGEGLPLPINLNQPLSDWITFHTKRIPTSFPTGENTMFFLDNVSDSSNSLSLWINDNYLRDDDLFDAYVEISSANAFEVQNITDGSCR
jgi:hypothetical protein